MTSETYAHARSRVLDAQQALVEAFERHGRQPAPATLDPEAPPEADDLTAARGALREASEALRAAEEPLAEQIERAWEANRQAVSDAGAAAEQAHHEWTQVAIEVGNAARARRARPEDLPVPTDDEIARVEEAGRKVVEARAAYVEAQQRFKAGVTVEQLES